jgi:hypothetical protein
MVASLQGVLEVDAASGEMAAASNNKDSISSAPSHPRDFSKIFRDKKTAEVDVDKLQLELFAAFMASLDQGFVRIAKPAQRELREPPVVERARSRWGGTRSDEGGARRTWSLASQLPTRTWSLPDVSKLVRENFPKKMRRLSTSMFAWLVSGRTRGVEGCQRKL